VQLNIEPGEELIRSFVATRLNGYVGGYGSLENFEQDKDKLALPKQIEEYVRNQIRNKSSSKIDC